MLFVFMALYLKPPKSSIGFNKLCDFAKKRLIFLHCLSGKSKEEITSVIHQETVTANSECLIEGSPKDKISHFILRFLCAAHSQLKDFFIRSETELFAYRLEFYDFSDIQQILKKSVKQSLEICNYQYTIKTFKRILTALVFVSKDFELSLKCNQNLRVPFTVALDFVKERSYPLHSGYIEIPRHEIKCLLTLIFKELLTQGINQMKSSCCMREMKDSRMHYMQQQVKNWFDFHVAVYPLNVSSKLVLEEYLDEESQRFPLCMKNLHVLLRRNHRLQHNSRVQYILFLKEIGVSCQEVLKLFMKEYSVPVNSKLRRNLGNCGHSWKDSKKRYIYSIEHLYGKQGSRKNYKAHSCYTLQSFGNSSNYDGGCPFTCFEGNNIPSILGTCSSKVQDIEDIQCLVTEKKYTEACRTYLIKKMESFCCPTSKTSNDSFCIPKKLTQCSASASNTNDVNINSTSFNISGEKKTVFKKVILSQPSNFYFTLANL